MELYFSTGIEALDEVLHGILPGDNIVFQVDSIEDYVPFVHAFCTDNDKNNRTLIYFRFADHESLLPENVKAQIFELHPENGFEFFINEIFTVIENYGHGACYVFDSLSELAVDWYSDRMLANFFMLTCPYLYDFETGTYFVLLRGRHSQYTVSRIHDTAQIILDVYKKDDKKYLHPLKVWKRYSPTMYMLHVWEDEKFKPVIKSAETSEILAKYVQPWVDFTTKTQDFWSRTFFQAHQMLQALGSSSYDLQDIEALEDRIIRMAVTRDPNLYPLVKKYFDLADLLNIGRRMIGTGLIGGKSVGLLLAQAILKKTDTKWEDKLEIHDSFFIGSDVFYTYLVINNCWWIRQKLRKSEDFLDLASEARYILANGKFPKEIIEQFKNILYYFGQSPIIVRSSSLLEDQYGNAFSGKYLSVFLANRGTPEERLKNFINAVKKVYESTLSEEALQYRSRKNLLDQDEQMAILVQRVSGASYGELFYPQLAGVGFSFNPFVWSDEIDPEAGFLRLVFGLGTRAVDRYDDDYTRIVALNAPEKSPEANLTEKAKYSQHKVDILNLRDNIFKTNYFDDIITSSTGLDIELFATRDHKLEEELHRMGREKLVYSLDLDKRVLKSPVIADLKEIFKILSKAYAYPVDVEFTVNFIDDISYKIYVLQCRPFQVKSGWDKIEEPKEIKKEDIILKTKGPIIGNSIAKPVDRVIYVVPEVYSTLSMQERYSVARLIGKLNHIQNDLNEMRTILIGPGRWATTSPSLGVPVSFSEINNVSIVCEIAEMHDNLIPDVSLGTHFFNDLVESNMLYLALHPQREEAEFNREIFNNLDNNLLKLIPEMEHLQDVVKVIESSTENKINIYADAIKQTAILYFKS
ncbi:MAG: pyruvate, phosphate dikinase [Candidatus Lokiarchaeota archaeon]|nr:pyruvate, phosphate dikinase [Candidatus Lokiarchaeota archaeon]